MSWGTYALTLYCDVDSVGFSLNIARKLKAFNILRAYHPVEMKSPFRSNYRMSRHIEMLWLVYPKSRKPILGNFSKLKI